MEFVDTTSGLLMHQQTYATELLDRFKMAGCNSARSPLEANAKLKVEEAEESVNETIYK